MLTLASDSATTLKQDPLLLPAPSDGAQVGQSVPKLDVSTGEEVKLDVLGPLVVNSDGTLSRIDNWAQMTDAERERTLRVLSKRNKLRLAAQGAGDGEAKVSALS
ncbi:hypothetical protein BJ165DRAFT_1495168 [Panaeolus papilionaceus]|nr:hypothetical protein BJ165DRAFT_1495168 [Panaeolus papilionaceus]